MTATGLLLLMLLLSVSFVVQFGDDILSNEYFYYLTLDISELWRINSVVSHPLYDATRMQIQSIPTVCTHLFEMTHYLNEVLSATTLVNSHSFSCLHTPALS